MQYVYNTILQTKKTRMGTVVEINMCSILKVSFKLTQIIMQYFSFMEIVKNGYNMILYI